MGSQTDRTRGSAAALHATSGPMPAGSPAVIAIRGMVKRALGSAAAGAAAAVPAPAGSAARRIIAAAFAAAPAVLNALRVRQLVSQTALEPSAEARELGGIQAQVLLLRHLDRDRLERVEERRAAERAATGAVPADHFGFVPNSNLAHLDPGPELPGKFADQLA